MKHSPKTPRDMLADDENHFSKEGVTIRKETMAAVLANAEIVEDPTATANDKQKTMKLIFA